MGYRPLPKPLRDPFPLGGRVWVEIVAVVVPISETVQTPQEFTTERDREMTMLLWRVPEQALGGAPVLKIRRRRQLRRTKIEQWHPGVFSQAVRTRTHQLAARQREQGREYRVEMLAPICVPPFPVLPPNNAGKLYIRQKQFYAPQGQHPAMKIPEETPRRP